MIIDFIIGLTLVNTLPHFTLGIWNGKMFSLFGFGNKQNILYGILNFITAISLFLYKYGLEGLSKNYMFLGGCFVIVSYFIIGKYLYNKFSKNSIKH